MCFLSRMGHLTRMLGFLAALGFFVSGCATDSAKPSVSGTTNQNGSGGAHPIKPMEIDTIYVGDRINITYADAPITIAPTEVQVPDTGKINVHRGYEVEVANKKTYEVAKQLTELYTVKENLYRQITITVTVLGRSISVGGEVKTPGSFAHDGNVTLLKAINKASGFTEYADRRKVTVTHLNGDMVTIDCKKAVKDPKLDIVLYPGDYVNVPRWRITLLPQ